MNSTVRHSLPFVLALGLIAAPALAQDPPEKTPVVREGGIKSLKPAALPAPKVKQPERPLKATPKVKDRPGADDDAPSGSPTGSPTSRRPAPGAAPTTGAGPAPRNEELPAWQQVEESDEEPTLSKDFIRNCARLKPGVKVNLDIYDEDLEAVVKLIACLTGQNIILAKSLKGKKITIYSPKKVTAREAYRAFLTALEANGYTISKQGNFLRIIEIKDFATSADPILPPDRDLANEDQMVTQILQLRHIDAGELNDVLSKLASPNAQFIVYQPTNSLIVTELSSNLRKLKTLIAELDVPGGQEELWVYQVLNADAADIASKITEIFEQEAAGSSPAANARSRPRAAAANAQKAPATASSATVGESELDAKVGKVIADERTNRLLIVASRRSYRKIKSLIEKLDIAIPGDGQIHILQLNNAKAADLASTLSNLSNEARNQRQAQNRRAPVRQARGGAAAGAAAGGDSAALFEGEVSITADENTNALVITASLKDFLALKSVVDELDRPRRQVFIEAVIMEVTINGSREFGLNSHLIFEGPSVAGEKTALAFNNQVDSEVNSLDLVGSAAALSGIGMTSLGGDAAGLPIPPFGVILNAIARSDDVNVLSAPHILTTDNEEAEIVVGSNVPFLQSATGGLGGGLGGVTSLLNSGGLDTTGALGGLGGASSLLGGLYNPTTITREDVALTLRITPRISAENQVTLEIDQEIEEVAGTSDLGPTTTKRSIKTNIIVGDQKTIVIGGLQKNKQTSSHNGVPILSEIPVLGYFFRRTSNSNERVNLLLMLTPYVIEGPEDFREIFLRKMEEHREFVSRFHKKGDQYVLGIDYGKKHGMLESINQSMGKLREEQELIEELRRREQGPPLPQELDGLDDPEAAGADGPTPARTIAVVPAAPALDVAPVPAELGDDDGDAPEEAINP